MSPLSGLCELKDKKMVWDKNWPTIVLTCADQRKLVDINEIQFNN